MEFWASQVALVVKNPPANAGDIRDANLFPGLGRSPGGGHDNPFQYSCLENHMDIKNLYLCVIIKHMLYWLRTNRMS